MNPYEIASYELKPHGITARSLSRRMGKSDNVASNVITGRNRWNPDIEAALYVESDGNVELVDRIKVLATEAYRLRHLNIARDAS